MKTRLPASTTLITMLLDFKGVVYVNFIHESLFCSVTRSRVKGQEKLSPMHWTTVKHTR